MSPRVRVIAVASLLVVFFGFGAVWLVARATSTAAPDQAGLTAAASVTDEPPSDAPSATPEPGTAQPESTGPDSTSSGGGDPPKPRRSVRVAGADLKGGAAGESCAVLLIDNLEVTVWVDGISVSAKPEPVTAAQDDQAGCGGQSVSLCAGGSLAPDGAQCLVGLGLDGSPPGTYDVVVSLDLRVRCTSAKPVPCNQIEGPAPTTEQPVDAIWSAPGPALPITWDGPPNPGTEPGTEPGTNPGTEPGTSPGTSPGTDPGSDPGGSPSGNPGGSPPGGGAGP